MVSTGKLDMGMKLPYFLVFHPPPVSLGKSQRGQNLLFLIGTKSSVLSCVVPARGTVFRLKQSRVGPWRQFVCAGIGATWLSVPPRPLHSYKIARVPPRYDPRGAHTCVRRCRVSLALCDEQGCDGYWVCRDMSTVEPGQCDRSLEIVSSFVLTVRGPELHGSLVRYNTDILAVPLDR